MDRLNVRIYVLFLLLFGTFPVVVLSTKTIMEAFTDNTTLVVHIRRSINSTRTECYVYSERAHELPINRTHVTLVTPSELQKLMDKCPEHHDANGRLSRKKRAAIFPGTKWCGIGNSAKDFSDLGSNVQADVCCREHDHCGEFIEPFAYKYGLHNFSFFTRSSCDCDRKFKNCLLKAAKSDNLAADVMYKVYFKFLAMSCIEQKKSNVCVERYNIFLCKRYDYVNKWVFSKV